MWDDHELSGWANWCRVMLKSCQYLFNEGNLRNRQSTVVGRLLAAIFGRKVLNWPGQRYKCVRFRQNLRYFARRIAGKFGSGLVANVANMANVTNGATAANMANVANEASMANVANEASVGTVANMANMANVANVANVANRA